MVVLMIVLFVVLGLVFYFYAFMFCFCYSTVKEFNQMCFNFIFIHVEGYYIRALNHYCRSQLMTVRYNIPHRNHNRQHYD